MNRRDFLAGGFKLGAAGLLLPVIEPVRRVWALDRTMIPTEPMGIMPLPYLTFGTVHSGSGPLLGDVFLTSYDENYKLNVWDGSRWVIVNTQNDIDYAIQRLNR